MSMYAVMRSAVGAISASLAISCGDNTGPGGFGINVDQDLMLEEVASGFTAPLFLTHPAGDSRLFVVEQAGRIRIVDDGQVVGTPFLDIQSLVLFQGEQGLLSMAFHPNFGVNGFVYVYYTDLNGDSQIVRYTATGDAADPNTAVVVMTVPQPFGNHNGGLIAFGLDGMLYVALGDGGSAGDPQGNGQNTATLLGSILRIDVDTPDPGMNYGIPGDNPFVGDVGAREEIWIYGLRNPWRFAFDGVDELLYVADVGQNSFEEVTVVDAAEGGLNFGWNVMEGMSCYLSSGCDMTGLVLPILQYENGANCSVTGGYVYRGTALTGLQGHYFYSDYCGGFLRSFRVDRGAVADEQDWGIDAGNVTSFGVDVDGELYMLVADGRVLKIVPAD